MTADFVRLVLKKSARYIYIFKKNAVFFLSDFATRASCNMLPERLISHGLSAENSRHFATPSDWFPGEMTSK